jgi:hypothetical protein
LNSLTQFGRASILLGWSILLTALTGILGGAPLKALRLRWGGLCFWLVCLGISTLMLGMAWTAVGILFLLITVVVGVQTELQLKGIKLRESCAVSLFVSSLVALGIAGLVILRMGPSWKSALSAGINDQLQKFATPEIIELIKAEDLLFQIPSLVIVVLMLVLGLSLIMEKIALQWVGESSLRKEKLTSFSVPDFFIWTFITGLLLGFWRGGDPSLRFIGLNLLNIAAVAYFFQGLAVVCTYFEAFRVGPVWRAVALVLFVLHLFLLLSLLGILDYWLNFRVQIARRAAAIKRKRLSE